MSRVTVESEHSQRSMLSRRRSSFLSELSRELVEVPVQHEYVYGGKAEVAARHSQLAAVVEKGESGEVEGVNLLDYEEEPDHRTGEGQLARREPLCCTGLAGCLGQCGSAS